MKKRILYINICALLLLAALSFSSCSIFMANPLNPDLQIKDNTDKPYYTDYPNGDLETETDKATGPVDPDSCEHKFGEWAVVQEIGCFGIEGIKERVCGICNSIERLTEKVEGHASITVDPAKEATCSAEGLTEGKHCETCGEVLMAQSIIPIIAHSYDGDDDTDCNVCGFSRDLNCEHHNIANIEAKKPTCIEAGYTAGQRCKDCGEFIVEQQMISAPGHTEEIVLGYAPTETEYGLTDGKICSVCQTVTVPQRPIMPTGYANIDLYASTYAYDALASLEKGEALQALYNSMDAEATRFHTDTTIDAVFKDNSYVVASFDFSKLGLTSNDAIIVWSSYKSDHPLYYWIDSRFTYNTEILNLISGDDYAKGEDREKYNRLVFDTAREYLSYVNHEESPYRIALALHDAIIKNTDYAYQSDGVSPETALWAHNVLGVFEKKSGVCESYAKTFQLLLNYCGIENVYVIGESFGEDHAWNMVKMDDGEWYWFDLTWDDTPDWMLGVSYNYFCTTDDQDVSWIDGPWVTGSKTFLQTHTYFTPTTAGVDYLYALPKRAENKVDLDIDMLRDVFTVDQFKYVVTGSNEVHLIGVLCEGDVSIPETVVKDGYKYRVVGIGGMADGLIKTVPIETTGEKITNIIIPEGVSLIWDKALMLDELEHIKVVENNPVYTSLDGILFTKDLYTLVQYPIGSPREEYAVPDATVEIANYSFGDGATGSLRSFTLGKNVTTLGTVNAGYGHRNSEGGRLNLANGDFFYIRGLMNFKGKITISPENKSFIATDTVVYSADGKTLCFITDTSITAFECPETVQYIDVGAFFGCSMLRNLIIGSSVLEIRSYAFGYCSYLQSIKYGGSTSGWNEIVKQPNWNAYAPRFQILCAQ